MPQAELLKKSHQERRELLRCKVRFSHHHPTSSSIDNDMQQQQKQHPMPSFGQYVADRWKCDPSSEAEERVKAMEVAETFIFEGKPDTEQMEEASTGKGCFPDISARDVADDDRSHHKSPIIDILEDLANEYFGHNWDRTEEMIHVNQASLEAWKARRTAAALARRSPSMEGLNKLLQTTTIPSSPSHSKRAYSELSVSQGKGGGGKEDSSITINGREAPTPPPFKRRGHVMKLKEDAIDLVLEGISGIAVENGRSAHVPGLEEARLILLEVYSDHCPQCHLMAPKLRQVAQHFRDEPQVMVACVDGPANPAFLERLDIQFYPTLKVIDRDIRTVFDWPICTGNSVSDIIDVIDKCLERNKTSAPPKSLAAATPPIVNNLMALLAEVPVNDQPPSFQEVSKLKNELVCHRDLASRRKWVSAMEIFRQLGCADEESCRAMTRSHNKPEDDPPHLVMMGGGMGSGKSSLKRMVTQTEFWRRYGRDVVQVEADHFKAIDPVYQLLTVAQCQRASEVVHSFSTQAAEELFLSALKFRRDIIFDSTLAWEPFLRQTLMMVRDVKHSYRRGPGYVESKEDESATEQYWEVDQELPGERVPYRVELIGVYVKPEVAVRRALIRQLLSGRGVPVKEQLRSHALFAKNFRVFANDFDTVVLYDNNATHERGEAILPREIARKDANEKELRILDEEAFRSFEAVAQLNIDATCVEELYNSKGDVNNSSKR